MLTTVAYNYICFCENCVNLFDCTIVFIYAILAQYNSGEKISA